MIAAVHRGVYSDNGLDDDTVTLWVEALGEPTSVEDMLEAVEYAYWNRFPGVVFDLALHPGLLVLLGVEEAARRVAAANSVSLVGRYLRLVEAPPAASVLWFLTAHVGRAALL